MTRKGHQGSHSHRNTRSTDHVGTRWGGGRHLSTGQEEGLHQEPGLLAPWFGASSLQSCEETGVGGLAPSRGCCYGSWADDHRAKHVEKWAEAIAASDTHWACVERAGSRDKKRHCGAAPGFWLTSSHSCTDGRWWRWQRARAHSGNSVRQTSYFTHCLKEEFAKGL